MPTPSRYMANAHSWRTARSTLAINQHACWNCFFVEYPNNRIHAGRVATSMLREAAFAFHSTRRRGNEANDGSVPPACSRLSRLSRCGAKWQIPDSSQSLNEISLNCPAS